ncbi:MAG: UDP-2,4-diacetamido-2,4,6-trideoxy-beta-L-altropyranose hydrolase [Bacteroidota bacterium]
MKKIVFRADGNSISGLGHLYRIFALLEMCKDDFDCILLTREDSAMEVIPASYNCRQIPALISLEEEPSWIRQQFDPEAYLIVADGYHFNGAYQQKLKHLHFKLVYIDDMAQGQVYADLIINHAPSAHENQYKTNEGTRLALGTGFSMVRPLFLKAAAGSGKTKKMDTAFVCFGGADPFELSDFVCKTLVTLKEIKKINVVVGGAFKSRGVFNVAEQYSSIQVHQNLSEAELLQVMQESDFAVAPCSTILFELCCVKMPVLTGYYVDNQKEAYYAFLNEKAVAGADNFKELTAQELEKLVHDLLNSDNAPMLQKQAELFDGKQKERIVKILNTL